MKKILFIMLTLLVISYLPTTIPCTYAAPQTKEIIAEGTYQAGDQDTPAAAQEAALLLAKRNALEQCGTLVTSSTIMKNYIVKDDTVTSLAAGVMEITILDKRRTQVGNGTEFYTKIRAIVYPAKLETALKQLESGNTPIPINKPSKQKKYNDMATQLLKTAVLNEDLEQVRQSFQLGADPNTIIFLTAIDKNAPEIVQEFIHNGVDVNHYIYRGRRNTTPLREAIISNYFSIIEILVDAGANLNLGEKEEGSSLLLDLVNNNDPSRIKTVKYLIDKGININKSNKNGNTPLIIACRNNNIEAVRILLKNGADPNKSNNQLQKPLNIAIENRNKELIDILLPLTSN